MSTSEFWREEPTLMWAYLKSYIDKNKREQEKINFISWLQGFYTFYGTSMALYNSFGRKNGMEAKDYLKEPLDLFSDKEEQERKRILEMEERIKRRNQEIKEILLKNKGEETGESMKKTN